MAHNILNDAELKMLLSDDRYVEEIPTPRRLRLTLKYLYQLIGDIQHEKQLLASRVDELEQQLYELFQIREEEASAHHDHLSEEAIMKNEVAADLKSAIPEIIVATRSERHPKPEKTSFWDFLLRR